MARSRLNDLLPESARPEAEALLAQAMPPDTGSSQILADADLEGIAEGGAAPVGADMGEDLPPEQAESALMGLGLNIPDQQSIEAQLEEAARRKLMTLGQ